MGNRRQKKGTNQPANSTEADPLTSASSDMLTPSSEASNMETDEENPIMKAINDMRDDFSGNFTGVLTAIQGIKHDFKEFTNKLAEDEQHIGDTEDNVTTLQKSVAELQKQVSHRQDGRPGEPQLAQQSSSRQLASAFCFFFEIEYSFFVFVYAVWQSS